ncbi:phage neck terminator protein [Tissierella praeacuta]|uniref:phage neck terminator protein n=1 Tax=Tissierella praeacuta TaxID=43131 RepID=UPI003DA400CB
MIAIKEIRDAIVKGLYDYLGLIPIPIEDAQKKDPPYITYNFINSYTQQRGQGNYSIDFVPSTDERFELDVEETLEVQPQATISINAYSKDKLEAQELAKKAMDWFKHIGWQYLYDSNIVVVSIEAFGDRSILIVDHYEFRIGFDVIIRFTDEIKRRFETIETWDINAVIE